MRAAALSFLVGLLMVFTSSLAQKVALHSSHGNLSTRSLSHGHHHHHSPSRKDDADVHIHRPRGEAYWHTILQVGHEKLRIDLDTGSTSLAVQGGAYHPGSTAKDLKQNFTISFGYPVQDTKIDTQLYQDAVKLGPLTGRVEVQRTVDDKVPPLSSFDGLMGLRPIGYNLSLDIGFLPALRKTSQWNGIFSMDCTSEGGIMGFDRPVGGDYKGNIAWVRSRQDDWAIRGHLGDVSAFEAYLDSGDSTIDVPETVVRDIVARFPQHLQIQKAYGALYMVGPCDWVPASLPFRFNGIDVHLTREAFWLNGPIKDEPGHCYSSIVGIPDLTDQPWILGVPFFLSAYLAFDLTPPLRIGIAHKRE